MASRGSTCERFVTFATGTPVAAKRGSLVEPVHSSPGAPVEVAAPRLQVSLPAGCASTPVVVSVCSLRPSRDQGVGHRIWIPHVHVFPSSGGIHNSTTSRNCRASQALRGMCCLFSLSNAVSDVCFEHASRRRPEHFGVFPPSVAAT